MEATVLSVTNLVTAIPESDGDELSDKIDGRAYRRNTDSAVCPDRTSPLNSIGLGRPTRNWAVVRGGICAVPRDCNPPMAKVTGTLPLA